MHWNMFLKLITLLVSLQATKCSVVVDSFSQKGLYISDYCPHMEFCPEGAHVMCMYYNPDQEMGPKCSNPQNVTMTTVTANQLLDITNAIRSKIANGRETGKNGTRLPRGFGIFRLRWDNELATLAQVLANQCVLEHDLCRATKKFPDPGQAAGLVRFTYPAWIPVNRADIQSQPPGLDDSKIAYAATQTMKSWYMQKASVTEDMIMRFPLVPINNLYVKVIHGSATHMGCGISAYTELAVYKAKESMTYNSILIICNFSSRPRPGELIYSVLPTRGSSTCGCPEGTQEDSDCLCNEASPPTPRVSPEAPEPESCQNLEQNCEPRVVLLPIFTVEDAPPDKLMDQVEDIREPLTGYIADRLNNVTIQGSSTLDDIFGNTSPQRPYQPRGVQKPGSRHYQAVPHSLSPLYQVKPGLLPQSNQASQIARSEAINRKGSSPRRSYVYSQSDGGQRRFAQSPRQPAGHKSSIFSRVAKFKLPNGGNNFPQYESIKPDVKPRKDFKNIQRIVNNYIQQRNSKFRRTEVVANKHQENLNKITLSTTPKLEEITETVLNNVEESIINFDHFHQKSNSTIEDNIKHFDLNYEESDNKLMTLLDTLEREVKHVELDGTEKEIFDAKIRKIYDTVVRKPTTTYPPIPMSNSLSKSHIKALPMLANLYENDFGEPKPFMKQQSNHIADDDHRGVRHEPDHLSEESRNGYKQLEKVANRGTDYDFFDKVGDKGHSVHNDDKNTHYDNDMLTDSDHKLFADIESKYNERLIDTLSARRFNDGVDKFGSKYDSTVGQKYSDPPVSKTRHNNVKYENFKLRAASSEVRRHRAFENYRDKEPSVKDPVHHDIITRKMYRNNEDDRKVSTVDRRDGKGNPWPNEFDQNDPLSVERRKYYQDKLENLERRLHDRSFRRKNFEDRPNERPFRRMRPNMEQQDRQKPKSQGDGFYLPDRARFLHGF